MSLRLTLSAVFIALAVALGFALVHVPNVELVTLAVFTAGFLLGARRGFSVGLCSMGLFTVFNPLGVPVPIVAISQITAMAIVGSAGGLCRTWLCRGTRWARLALLGFVCTLFYDVMTNTAMALAFGLLSKIAPVLIAGLTFSLLHLASNVVFFAAAGPLLMRMAARLPQKPSVTGE